MKADHGLELLLNLDGEIFPMDNGYWTRFEDSPACLLEYFWKEVDRIIENQRN